MELYAIKEQLLSLFIKHDLPMPEALYNATNDYNFLQAVKVNACFLIKRNFIDADWFNNFSKDLLWDLNIFNSGSNNMILQKRNYSALVIDAHLTADIFAGATTIEVYGKGYLEVTCSRFSASFIKLSGKSKAEVTANGNAVVSILRLRKAEYKLFQSENAIVKRNN